MTQIKRFASILFVILLTNTVYSQFTRQQATDLVMNDIVNDDSEIVDVFSKINSETASVFLIDNEELTNTYSESWVFFIDESPFASWYHDSRFVFVSADDGDYSIETVSIYPKNLNTDYELTSSADRPDTIAMDGTPFDPDPQKVASNYNFALIIVALDNPRNWFNTSLIYNVLKDNYNYQSDNIIVLYSWDGNSTATIYENDLDGPAVTSNDIDGPATWENIQTTITNLTTDLGHGDQLAVFFTGVPISTSGVEPQFYFPINEYFITGYPVSGLSEPMEDIDCGQMLLTFDVNFSSEVSWYFEAENGTGVLCENRYLHGPTGSNEYNYEEMYFSTGKYSEHLFYWASAARGFLPEVGAPWNTITPAIGYENGGGFPYNTIPGLENHPGDNILDDDDDSFIQMGEAFQYADDMNTWTTAYCYLPYNDVPLVAPQQTDEIPFAEDLLTLAGLSGYIETTQNMPSRSYIMADELYLNSGVSLTFADNTEFYININKNESNEDFVFSTSFEPESGYAIFLCYENSNLTFGNNSLIENNSELSAWGKISFVGEAITIGNGSEFANIKLITIPTSSELSLNNISFKNSYGNFISSDSNIESCSLFHSIFWIPGMDSEINNCNFIHSSVWVFTDYTNPHAPDYYLIINNCYFDYSYPYYTSINPSIKAAYFDNISITNNKILHSQSGVNIQNCGDGLENHILYNNKIYDIDSTGVIIYSSRLTIDSNYIYNCGKNGLSLFNNCNIELLGNKAADSIHETQRIMDNVGYEIYTDESSFPTYFRWNAIIDDDNLPVDDELLYCQGIMLEKDVRYNFWGNNFDPEEDFFPVGAYNYEPIFELVYEGEDKSDAEQLYDGAQGKFEQEDYTGAKNDFQQVVQQYPDSRFARASMKELYALEKYESDDYSELKQYFRTNTDILNDSSLTKLGDFLANRCDIILENWPTAITWFEDVIEYPPSFSDSIYAIIDLQSTYLIMQQGGNKSTHYTGSMPQYVPESPEAHDKNTQYLLSLLPGDKKKNKLQENLSTLKSGELLQNAPNPFSGTTQIWYKLDEDANISIKIFDYIGRCIKTFNQGTIDKGTHSISFSSEGLPSGVYFYTLEINSNLSDSKKMTILK